MKQNTPPSILYFTIILVLVIPLGVIFAKPELKKITVGNKVVHYSTPMSENVFLQITNEVNTAFNDFAREIPPTEQTKPFNRILATQVIRIENDLKLIDAILNDPSNPYKQEAQELLNSNVTKIADQLILEHSRYFDTYLYIFKVEKASSNLTLDNKLKYMHKHKTALQKHYPLFYKYILDNEEIQSTLSQF